MKHSAKYTSGKFVKSSWYIRGGRLKDKYGNVKNTPLTLRNNHTGSIINSKGVYQGTEKNRQHSFGNDPRRVSGGRAFRSDAQRKAVMSKLRGRRR